MKMPNSPFATSLSRSAKETELRLRSIFQWKKKRPPVIALAAAVLVVALCGSLVGFTTTEPSAADDSIPDSSLQEKVPVEETLISAPAADATQEVLNYIDALFENGNAEMWCFLLPGTGPLAVSIDEFHEQVREIVAQYTWAFQEEEENKPDSASDGWTLYLNSTGNADGRYYHIDAKSNSAWIKIYVPTPEGSTPVCYRYNGEPGSLNDALTDLWDGPEIRYALVTLPETMDGGQTLMEAYADAFRELYLASDAITDYELYNLKALPLENADDFISAFTMTYAVKPTNPSASCWEYYQNETPREDGWVTCFVEMHLNLVDGVWCSAWWEYSS